MADTTTVRVTETDREQLKADAREIGMQMQAFIGALRRGWHLLTPEQRGHAILSVADEQPGQAHRGTRRKQRSSTAA